MTYSDIKSQQEILKLFKITDTTIRLWRTKGLSFIKIGKKVYYKLTDVERFLEKYKNGI